MMVQQVLRRQRTNWNPEKPASPIMLDSLFDEIGIGDEEGSTARQAREAALRYCTDAILQAMFSGYELRVGHVECLARAFYSGFRSARQSP